MTVFVTDVQEEEQQEELDILVVGYLEIFLDWKFLDIKTIVLT